MNKSTYLVLICFILQVYTKVDRRIYNGEKTDIIKYPFMASVRWNSKHRCAGSIISTNTVLTAAHCCATFDKHTVAKGTIMVGNTYKYDDDSPEYCIDWYVKHPDFVESVDGNDISVIRIVNKFEFCESVQPILLSPNLVPSGLTIELIGWGRTEQELLFKHQVQESLHFAEISVLLNEDCDAAYKKFGWKLNENMFCVGSDPKNVSACKGDSGAPYVYNNMLVGFVVYGYGCGDPKYPKVATRVSGYLDWLKQYII